MKGNSTGGGSYYPDARDGALYVKVKSTIALIVDGALILRDAFYLPSSKPRRSRAWNLGRRRVAKIKQTV
jgi:hypothetical protein